MLDAHASGRRDRRLVCLVCFGSEPRGREPKTSEGQSKPRLRAVEHRNRTSRLCGVVRKLAGQQFVEAFKVGAFGFSLGH